MLTESLEVHAFAPVVPKSQPYRNTQVHTKSCAKIAIAAVSVRVKVGNTIDVHQRQGVKILMASSHNMEYHAEVKKNEVDF